MDEACNKTHRYLFRVILNGLLLAALIMLAGREVHAQSYLMPENDTLADVIEQLKADDLDDAEETLNAVPSNARGADYHYLLAVLAMQQMNDAGALRMARLARRMKGHLEDAVDTDADHALAHFGLMQFHRFAPGIMGGRQRQLERHNQRLIDIDSFLQFPAALLKAQMEEDEDAQREAYAAWIAHSPQMFEAHYGYLSSLLEWGDFTQARTVMNDALRLADDVQTQLVQYQKVRMAALAGLSDDPADAHQYRQQPWFSEAHHAGLSLLANEARAEQVDVAWLNMRLAQVEWALDDVDSAQSRIQLVLAGQPEERLEEQANALQSRLEDAR